MRQMVNGSYCLGGSRDLGIAIVMMSGFHRLNTLAPVMLIAGAAWVLFVSLINTLVQNLAPEWVRARVLAVFILVFQGSFALGTAVWGAVAQRLSVETALVSAGIGTIATTMFVLFAKLPDAPTDLSPWNHWRMPVFIKEDESDLERGPVLVTVEYSVMPERNEEFVAAIHQYGRIRRRDGAYSWGVFSDTEVANRYLEIMLVQSWAEHLRQHERITRADGELERRMLSYLDKDIVLRHLIYMQSKET
jgi:MFS family permease